MSYRDLLVHADNSEACAARLATAAAMAKQHGARLHGICAVPDPRLSLYADAPVPPSVLEAEIEALKADLAAAQRLFAEASSGLDSECVAAQGHVPSLVSAAGRYADLLVVGQGDVDDPRCAAPDLAAEAVFGSGCGVLSVPAKGRFESVGTRVVVAWNGSREAQRAVRDAAPILEGAEEVLVLSISDGQGGYDDDSAAPRLGSRLVRWGVHAHARVVSAGGADAGETLLAQSREFGADLLVLGAYGHSRLREFLLGGVTRHVLQSQEIPVLLAH